MSSHAVHTIRFDQPATVADLLEALEDLRAQVGPDAVVRVTGVIEFNINGPRVAAISADRPVRAGKDTGP
jgi:hypothetical protein